MTAFLGIDIGAGSVKAALFGSDGRQVAASFAQSPAGSEFDPEDWWTATLQVLAGLPRAAVAAVGVTGGDSAAHLVLSRLDGPGSAAAGLAVGTPVTGPAHPVAAAVLGAGAASPGVGVALLGAGSSFAVVSSDATAAGPALPLAPGSSARLRQAGSSGLAVEWARKVLPGADAEASPPGCGGVLFVPGHFAEGAAVPGGWHGVTPATTAHNLLAAVLEAAGFAIREARDELEAGGYHHTRTVAAGGGARYFLQAHILADILQERVEVAACEEGCRGAALLAAVACGGMTLDQALAAPVECTTYEPSRALAGLYDAAYARAADLASRLSSAT